MTAGAVGGLAAGSDWRRVGGTGETVSSDGVETRKRRRGGGGGRAVRGRRPVSVRSGVVTTGGAMRDGGMRGGGGTRSGGRGGRSRSEVTSAGGRRGGYLGVLIH